MPGAFVSTALVSIRAWTDDEMTMISAEGSQADATSHKCNTNEDTSLRVAKPCCDGRTRLKGETLRRRLPIDHASSLAVSRTPGRGLHTGRARQSPTSLRTAQYKRVVGLYL